MKTIKDLSGKKFGRLTVLRLSTERGGRGQPKWICRCDCGNEKAILGEQLRSGKSKTCGCSWLTANGNTTHHLYKRWMGMHSRCCNPLDINWSRYGARGIRICERWQKFENFESDVGPTYAEGLSLDRIDNDGDYEPSNVRWATRKQQANNTRRNLVIEYRGKKLTALQWAKRLGLNYPTLAWRIRNGWDHSMAIELPPIDRTRTFKDGPNRRPQAAKSK